MIVNMNSSIRLDLDEENSRKLEIIARDSAMTVSRLVTDIVKGFLYRSEHSSEDKPLPGQPGYEEESISDDGRSTENCEAAFKDLYGLYDELSAEIEEMKVEIRQLRGK